MLGLRGRLIQEHRDLLLSSLLARHRKLRRRRRAGWRVFALGLLDHPLQVGLDL